MQSSRAPWWLFLAAGSYLAYFLLLVWCAFGGPADPGLVGEFAAGRMRIGAVAAGLPAGRAGLAAGDYVLAADRRPIRTRLDWMAVRANWEVNRPTRLDIDRTGRRFTATLVLARWSLSDWLSSRAVVALALWSVRLATLLLAFVVAFRRPRNSIARTGAWFLATAAVSFVVVQNGVGPAWRQLPGVAGALLWPPMLSTLALAAISLTFFALFPSGRLRRGWVLALAWAPALVVIRPFAEWLYHLVYQPEPAAGMLADWVLPVYCTTFVAYLAGGVGLLALHYRKLADAGERRRVRLLALGAVVGWAAVVPLIVYDWQGAGASHAPQSLSYPVALAAAAVFLAGVLAVGHVLLRRRVFGIGLILRQGLRYALARRLLVSVTPALGVVLAADLLLNADQPLASLLRARGWIYVALAALALTAQSRRQRWLEALDRRFFRERYDAERLLREVVEDVHRAGRVEQVAPRAVALIEAALHPEFVSLLLREAGETSYRSIAAAPAGQAPPTLPADSKLIALVRVLGKPFEFSATSRTWLGEQLPQEDTDFVRRAGIELLAPVLTGPAAAGEALLALGPKRSEEPYSGEDRNLLSAIAASLALLLERRDSSPTPLPFGETFQECPDCGACYDTGPLACVREGALLAPRPLPRVLVRRYRLERRLGRGGMGTVYEATDVALERRVAAKLIHDELVGSPEAADRFRREARAAAAFSHPNIVTVHDFGQAGARNAFLIMELLEGCNLREELRRVRRLPAGRTWAILRGVAEAVEAAHRRQLIHRDLKPENIFLARGDAGGETPKVLDFGVAKSLRAMAATTAATETFERTVTGVLVGTLHYMSPEQLLGEAPQPGWDLWALAVVAYEMLTGAYPFPSTTRAEWHAAVLAGRFTPLRIHWPEAPAACEEFFGGAFSPDAQRRPRSARQLFGELERGLG